MLIMSSTRWNVQGVDELPVDVVVLLDPPQARSRRCTGISWRKIDDDAGNMFRGLNQHQSSHAPIMLDRSHVRRQSLLCSLSSNIASTLTDLLPFLTLKAYMKRNASFG
jgi:hypothetical protein